jgi:hypothetical protein
MERNDVIKALKCCSAPVTECEECPVDMKRKADCVCGVYVAGEALKVIRELTVENERLSSEKEIIFINKIICESVIHGADRGGSYDSNENDLTEAINEWLKYKKLDHLFCVKLRDVRKDFGYSSETWRIPQIEVIYEVQK